MDLKKNYYQILGVNKDTPDADIKKAYRTLAKEHHPDATQNHDDSKFKEINEAFQVLGDTNAKAQYDSQSPNGKNYNPNSFENMFHFTFGNGGPGFNPFGPFGFPGGSPFDDPIFKDIFNRKEEFVEYLDINHNVTITLKDVYNNVNMPIKFTHNVKCDHCNFTGFDPASDAYECDACDGKGGDGFTKCRFCNGTGKIHSGTCSKCKGEKVIPKEEEFAFSNTFSVDKSFQKYMRGLGHQSKHYASKVGTLIINATYQDDARYKREGANLIFSLNLHFQHAIDGYDYEHEHLDGKKYSIKIPPKTKDGELLRISGKGLLLNNNQRGDLIVKINIIIDYEIMK